MSDTHGSDPLRGIPLEALRGFESAARLLNFTRAAEELHLTQSAVSREIRSLEDRLREIIQAYSYLKSVGLC